MEYDGAEYDDDEQYEDEQSDDDMYDVEKEDDRGEPEDMADDELERRITEFEEQADKAALENIEIIGPDGEPQGNSTLGVTKKRRASTWTDRKGRGPKKGLKKAYGPMHVQFDSLNRPCGAFRHQYGQNVGLCMRKLNINWDWQSVSVGLKDALWRDTMSLFNVPNDPNLKKTFLSSVARRFADFKSKLVSG